MDQLVSDGDSLQELNLNEAGLVRVGLAFERAASRIRNVEVEESETAPLLANSTADGPASRYVDRTRHASGGVGQVWCARDSVIGRTVALKALRDDREFPAHATDRFMNEARITAHLEHPGIVPVYDMGRDKHNQPFYTMRFVRGRTLRDAALDFAKQRKSGDVDWMNLRSLISAVVGVANAISYAHSRGVLHRDLKGNNILLGDYGEVLVLDWGLARMTDCSDADRPSGDASSATVSISASDTPVETADGSVVGTPSFMAPEQALGRGELMNERTDVYGLGAVLYQVLTGEAPFGSGDLQQVLQRARTEVPPSPAGRWPQVPRALQAICQKAMKREQQDRYASPADVADELNRWLADEPVQAFREPFPVRLARWSRRHRTVVTTVAALVIAAVVSLGVSTILISREQSRTLAAQVRAERNFGWANDTVNSLIQQVSQSGLTESPAMSAFRLTALQEAVRFNEQFLTDSSVPSVRLQAARASDRVADLYFMMGRYEESVQASEQAVATFQELLQDNPRLAEVPLALVACQRAMAERVLKHGDLEQCLALCDTAEMTLQKVTGSQEADAQLARVKLLRLRGQVETSRSKLSEAEAHLNRANEILADRDDDEAKEARARVYLELASLYRNTRNTEGALASIHRSVALLEQVTGSENHDTQAVLGTALMLQANMLKETGDRAESENVWRRSIKVREQLVEQLPFVPEYRRAVIDGYSGLAVLMAEAGKTDAEVMFRNALTSALELRDQFPPTAERRYLVATSRRLVGIWLLNRTKHAEARSHLMQAAEEFAALVADHPDVTDYRYRAASTAYNVAIAERGVPEFQERSEQTMLDAVSSLEALSEGNPAIIPFGHRLGAAYRWMAQICLDRDETSRAIEYFDKAIEVHRRIASVSSGKPAHARQLAVALYKLGEYHLEAGNIESAGACVSEALSINKELLAAQPQWFDAQMDVVLSNTLMGRICRSRNDPQSAEAHFRAGASACKPAIEQGLHGPGPSREYAEIIELIAQLRIDAGRLKEALEILEEPVEIFYRIQKEDPDKYEYRRLLRNCLRDRAQAYLGLRNREAAAAAVDEMLAVEPIDEPDHHVDAARLYAACAALSEGQPTTSESDQAVLFQQAAEQIRIAIDLGYETFQTDEAFDKVRERPEFDGVMQQPEP